MATSSSPTVALVQMPFAATCWPSLGLSLLKSSLEQAGIKSLVFYLNSVFADLVGVDEYAPLSNGAPRNTDLLSEWVFSDALWGHDQARDERYYDLVIEGGAPAHKKDIPAAKLKDFWDSARRCRDLVPEFIATCVAQYDWGRYTIVGFTSVFQQHLASLTLAREIKRKHPSVFIIFGGPNCEAEMGLATLKNFQFVDAVCSGEGDLAFPQFVEAVSEGRKSHVVGFLLQDDHTGSPNDIALPPPADLNALPFPNFDDFFEQQADRLENDPTPLRLTFETSRGCWWGQKHHCTFCGLNGSTMAFRQKDGDRAIREIEFLIQKYGRYTKSLSATDNIIPHKYFSEFLPKLASLGLDIDLFYETKANLRRDQVDLYQKAGLKQIQPGIESLDSDVLKLMKKGVTALQNIQLLVWCKEFGIHPYWNYLVGFPGEPEVRMRTSRI